MIFRSATKIVLLYMVFILGAIVAFATTWDVTHGQFGEVTKVILAAYTSAITFLFGYYFGSKNKETPTV